MSYPALPMGAPFSLALGAADGGDPLALGEQRVDQTVCHSGGIVRTGSGALIDGVWHDRGMARLTSLQSLIACVFIVGNALGGSTL